MNDHTNTSNAFRFISAYNVIDGRLRSIYRGKGNLQFTDLVRRCADINKTVRRHEEDLAAFARLRNAIVHQSTTERIIAEPCDEVTEQIEHIARLLSQPPLLSALKERSVTGIDAEATLREAIVRAAKTGYSNLPVYRGGRMAGILNDRRIVRALGEELRAEDADLEELLSLPCERILHEEDMLRFYCVLSPMDTIQEAIDAFENNRKLLAVVVTEHGRLGENILNIIRPADLPRLWEMLEE